MRSSFVFLLSVLSVSLLVSSAVAWEGRLGRPEEMPPTDADWHSRVDWTDAPRKIFKIASLDDAITTLPSPMISVHLRQPSEDACCECTGKVSHHIVKSILDEVTSACANVSCPVLQRECKWIAANEEEFTGVIVAKTRPLSLGFSYCMGTGECQHPNTSAISLNLFSRSAPEFLPAQLSASLDFLTRFNSSEGKSNEFQLVKESQAMSHPDGRRHCLKKAIRYVMHRSLRHLREECRKTDCPYMKKFCAFAKEHKPFVRGLVYGKVQPWKFAVGYCAGRDRSAEVRTE